MFLNIIPLLNREYVRLYFDLVTSFLSHHMSLPFHLLSFNQVDSFLGLHKGRLAAENGEKVDSSVSEGWPSG